MKTRLVLSMSIFTAAVAVSLPATSDSNGITKEDIKRLQVNAFAEEMQMEMGKSALSDLKTKMENTEPHVKADIASAVAEQNTIPEQPKISARNLAPPSVN